VTGNLDLSHQREANLLFAVLARRLRFVTPADLSQVSGAGFQPASDLGQAMLDAGLLTPKKKLAVEAMIEDELEAHADDHRATLEALGPEIKDLLGSIDPAARASLALGPGGPSIDDYLEAPAERALNVLQNLSPPAPVSPPQPLSSRHRPWPAPGSEADPCEPIDVAIDLDGDHYGAHPDRKPKPPPAKPAASKPVASAPDPRPAKPAAKGTISAADEPPAPASRPDDDDEVLFGDDDDNEQFSFEPDGGPGQSLADLGGEDSLERLTTGDAGRYDVKRELGRGAIGRVLIAYDKNVGREVALKELLSTRKGPALPKGRLDEKTARFLAEARVTGQLEHPGIVPVYEIAQRETGEIYYTMRVVRGQTMEEKMEACGTLRDRFKLLIEFIELCQAISYAHSRHVIHRDIKPANVMIGEFGETVVLDWGLAKVKGQKDTAGDRLRDEAALIQKMSAKETVAGRPIGTPSYMSPEQAEGKVDLIDERSDVWSLGAVLYEILTGRAPFEGESALAVVEKVIQESVAPVRSVAPHAPPELCAICEKCLRKDPAERYPNARALARDVQNYQAGGLVSAYNYLSGSLDLAVITRFIQRRWPVVATIAVSLIILAVSGAWFLYDSNQKRIRAEAAEAKESESRRGAEKTLVQAYAAKRENMVNAKAWGNAEIYTAQMIFYEDKAGAEAAAANPPTILPGKFKVKKSSAPARPASRPSLNDRFALNYFHTQRPLKIKATLWGHTNYVTDVVFSPDGKTLATKSADGTVKLWDYYSGKLLHSLEGHKDWVTAVVFSPDGAILATGSRDTTIKIWDTFSGKLIQDLSEAHMNLITDLAFSPDGRLLASASKDKTMKVWDTATWTIKHLKWEDHTQPVNAVAFSPDGQVLASASTDATIKLWDPETGALLNTLDHRPESAPEAAGESNPYGVWKMIFTPKGYAIISGTWGGDVLVWDRRGELRYRLKGHTKTVNALAVGGPDGRTLATGSWDNTVKLWDLDTGTLRVSLEGHKDMVLSIAFSPDGRTLASAGKDNTVKLWDIASGKLVYTLQGHTDLIRAVAFSPDGSILATASFDTTARLWELSSLKTIFHGHDGKIERVIFGTDENLFASIGLDNTVILWDSKQGQRAVLRGHDGVIRDAAFSPDGKTIASAGSDGVIKLWKAATAELVASLDGHTAPVTAIAFVQQGRALISAGEDRTVKIWSTYPGKLLQSIVVHERPAEMSVMEEDQFKKVKVEVLAVDPAGKLFATGSSDGAIKVWDLERSVSEGQSGLKSTLAGDNGKDAHAGAVTALVFTPDGATLISGGNDGVINFWDARTGARSQQLQAHNGPISAIVVAPDGQTLASASLDKNVKLFDLKTAAPVPAFAGEHKHLQGVTCVRFSPDGHTLGSGSLDGSVKLWEITTGRLITTLDDHTAEVMSLAFSPKGNYFVTSSYDGTIRIWPFFPEIIQADPAALLQQTQKENGLKIDGMDLILWDPATDKVLKPTR
jgi:eukaryotic-like serine/threonine-protein kinase